MAFARRTFVKGSAVVGAGTVVVPKLLMTDGRETLVEDRLITRRSCGSPITTEKVMDRIGGLLGDQQDVLDHASGHCLACRGSKTGPPRMPSTAPAGRPG